jgi:hypothetical protein
MARRAVRTGVFRVGVPGALVYHPCLSAEAICVHLAIEPPIGDTLQNLRRSGLLDIRGAGRQRQ